MKIETLKKLLNWFRPVKIRVIDENQNEKATFKQSYDAIAFIEAMQQESNSKIIEYSCNFDRFDIITR